MRLAEARATPLADGLVLAGFALCLGGSSLYLPYPLRPFHWGLALFLLALAMDRSWRTAAWQGRLKGPLLLLLLLLAIQPLWVTEPDRYIRYGIYLLIGAASAVLGETLARRRKPFLFLLPWLLAYWFVTAYFPMFDIWTDAQRFRPRYPLTGGVWDNINDMATVLVFANLIWLLCRRRLPLWLFSACWFYALLLNRRADLAAALVLGVAYLLWFVEGHKTRERLKMLAAWGLATVAAISLISEPLHLVSLPSIQSTASPPAVAVAPPPPATVPSTAASISAPPASAPGPAAPAPSPPGSASPAIDAAAPTAPGARSTPALTPGSPPGTASMPLHAPEANVRIRAQGGDESSAFRARLTMDMLAQWRAMPWWQWFTGLGAGQLDLTWPGNNAPWASPHFFWLEMFFHVGLLWFALLGWLAARLDGRGRVCLVVAGIAGLAPSSMVYFQPFWVLLGMLVASVPQRHAAPAPRAPRIP